MQPENDGTSSHTFTPMRETRDIGMHKKKNYELTIGALANPSHPQHSRAVIVQVNKDHTTQSARLLVTEAKMEAVLTDRIG
jgi:hypothetical protein